MAVRLVQLTVAGAAGRAIVGAPRAAAAGVRSGAGDRVRSAIPLDPDRPVASVLPPIATVYSSASMVCSNFAAHPNEIVRWDAPVVRVVNAGTDPDARLGILIRTIHETWCPVCSTLYAIPVVFDYYDPDRQLLVQIRPASEDAEGGQGWKADRMRELDARYAGYALRLDVVFGYDEMIATYLGGETAVEAARQEYALRIGRRDGVPDVTIAPSVTAYGW